MTAEQAQIEVLNARLGAEIGVNIELQTAYKLAQARIQELEGATINLVGAAAEQETAESAVTETNPA